MDDRALFLQDEITHAFFDDFMVLPIAYQHANVIVSMPEAQQRHSDCFKLAH